MTRFKTFLADGSIPDGTEYAGDLNAIQDRYADLSNLTQNHSVGTLTIGELNLQLLRYAALDARLTGSLRVDAITRMLSGGLFGAYTTTQRDAIPLGSRPFTLIIFNTTTNRLEINMGTDATPAWVGLLQQSNPSAKVTHATNQNIPDSTTTAVAFDTEEFDDGTMHAGGANTKFTCVRTGRYQVTYTLEYASNGVGVRRAWLRKNGNAAFDFAWDRRPSHATEPVILHGEGTLDLTVSDYVEVATWQNSGGALALNSDLADVPSGKPVFEIHKIGEVSPPGM